MSKFALKNDIYFFIDRQESSDLCLHCKGENYKLHSVGSVFHTLLTRLTCVLTGANTTASLIWGGQNKDAPSIAIRLFSYPFIKDTKEKSPPTLIIELKNLSTKEAQPSQKNQENPKRSEETTITRTTLGLLRTSMFRQWLLEHTPMIPILSLGDIFTVYPNPSSRYVIVAEKNGNVTTWNENDADVILRGLTTAVERLGKILNYNNGSDSSKPFYYHVPECSFKLSFVSHKKDKPILPPPPMKLSINGKYAQVSCEDIVNLLVCLEIFCKKNLEA